MSEFFFFIFAALAIGGGLGMVLSKQPIASLLYLVLSFFNLAAIYVLLEAHFIAAIQVIVYAGAIMVLFLFVIMLLNLGSQFRPDMRGMLWVVLAFIGAGVIGWAVWHTFGQPAAVAQQGGSILIDTSIRELNAVGAISMPLFQQYLVPFELTSVLLLVAAIGAVVLAKRRV